MHKTYGKALDEQEQIIIDLSDLAYDETGASWKYKYHSLNEEFIELYESSKWKSLGVFKITFYCACEKCCGSWSDGTTATGTKATAGRTIATDPEVIPLGSTVLIDGIEYIAEDTGGAINGNIIDLFVESHQEALNRGVIYKEVFIYMP